MSGGSCARRPEDVVLSAFNRRASVSLPEKRPSKEQLGQDGDSPVLNPHCSLYIGTSHQPFGPILVTGTLLPSSSKTTPQKRQPLSTSSKWDVPTIVNNHLLSTLNAFCFIFTAVHRCLSRGNGCGGSRVGDFAFKALHIHIRLAAVVRDPEPSTGAAGFGTGGHLSGNGVSCQAFPRGTVSVSATSPTMLAGTCVKQRAHCSNTLNTARFSRVTADSSD